MVLDEGASTLHVYQLPSFIKCSSPDTSGEAAGRDMSAMSCTYALLFPPYDMDSKAFRDFRLRWRDAREYVPPASFYVLRTSDIPLL